jgi:hypothetical protein
VISAPRAGSSACDTGPATAALHADQALALDGGSAWAWGRSGWIKAYVGEAAEAIERFQIARALAPSDPLNFLCSGVSLN